VLHARNQARVADARAVAPGAAGYWRGDLSSIDQMGSVAWQTNDSGPFDAVIHNAGVGYREPCRITTADGLSHVFAINVLAPHLLTAMIIPPRRLVYLSSDVDRGGSPDLAYLQWERRPWSPAQAYSDSKPFDVVLAFALARPWPQVLSNALEPGWVPTKMGGPGAYFCHKARRGPAPCRYRHRRAGGSACGLRRTDRNTASGVGRACASR
jgi:NAD(P)-dependent dehydrogenase (short-subunit alcohol dehydrogenase family)